MFLNGLERTRYDHNVLFCCLLEEKNYRARPQPTLGRPNVYHVHVSLRHAASDTTVRPALLMGARGGSAVEIVVAASGASRSVGRVLGNWRCSFLHRTKSSYV